MTQPERELWALLRDNALGLHFRRQHGVGPFILDFYCATAKLCVEIDGPSHADQMEQDERRTRWLNQQGIRVVRFSTDEVERVPASILSKIAQAAAPTTA
jgi:very-short-patch-repair endonuclease